MVASADEQVAEVLRKTGWQVLTKGWPDLLAYKPPLVSRHGNTILEDSGKIMAIEIKRGNDKLRPEQEEMRKVFLQNMNVPYHIAYDKDIENITRKKGRVVVPWSSLGSIQQSVADLTANLASLTKRVKEITEELDKVTVIFQNLPAPRRVDMNGFMDRRLADRFDAVLKPKVYDADTFRRRYER